MKQTLEAPEGSMMIDCFHTRLQAGGAAYKESQLSCVAQYFLNMLSFTWTKTCSQLASLVPVMQGRMEGRWLASGSI